MVSEKRIKKITKAYKLLKLRKNGTLGPLFIGRRMVIPLDEWLKAECIPTKGFAVRPGWHVSLKPSAPHLSMKNRVWKEVLVKDYKELKRPKSQGGEWLIANWMKVVDKNIF